MDNHRLEKQCLDCYRKHIGTAHAYFLEASTNRHPESFWKGIGQLVLAENHTRDSNPDLFAATETERLEMMEDEDYFFDFESLISQANNIIIKRNEYQSIRENTEDVADEINFLLKSYEDYGKLPPNIKDFTERAIGIVKEVIESREQSMENSNE